MSLALPACGSLKTETDPAGDEVLVLPCLGQVYDPTKELETEEFIM